MSNWFDLLNPTFLFANSLSLILNQTLRLNPDSLTQLANLDGRTIGVKLDNLSMRLVILPHADGVTVVADDSRVCDVSISAPPFTLMRLLLQENANLTAESDVIVNGKVGVLQQFFTVLRGLQVDWEEQVARVFGDMPAHQFGQWLRQIQDYHQTHVQSVQANLSEYLQEEGKQLPAAEEVADFIEQVDVLRDDVARLEQRITRLS